MAGFGVALEAVILNWIYFRGLLLAHDAAVSAVDFRGEADLSIVP